MDVLKNIAGKGMNGNTIWSKYFYMGREGFVFQNLYIPLDAVSVVKLQRVEDNPLKPYLITAVIGLLFGIGGIVGGSLLITIIALAVLVYGIFGIYVNWKYNQAKKYRILLKINNGESYTLAYGDLDFTNKVVDKIRTCIMKKNEAPNYYVNNGNIELIGEKSVGKVCDNIFNGNVGNIAAGEDIHINSIQSTLTDEDWDNLYTFLQERIKTFDTKSESYGNCRILIGYIQKKEDMKLKEFLKELSEEKKLQYIFSVGVDRSKLEKIKEIIRKL